MTELIQRLSQYPIDPILELAKESLVPLGVPQVLADILGSAARGEIDLAMKYIVSKNKVPTTRYGFEYIWKIAQRASIKREALKAHWRSLLRAALDPEFDQEIRMEDVDFMDTLNPADIVFIEVLGDRREAFREYDRENACLGELVVACGNSNDEVVSMLRHYFFDSKSVVPFYNVVSGAKCEVPPSEIIAIIETRANIPFAGRVAPNAILDLQGYTQYGYLKMAMLHDDTKRWNRQMRGSCFREVFGVGQLTPQAVRIGNIIKASKG